MTIIRSSGSTYREKKLIKIVYVHEKPVCMISQDFQTNIFFNLFFKSCLLIC